MHLPFGYKETEALIAFDVCIPNNNIATFRAEENSENRKLEPLFKRNISFKDDIVKLRERKILTRKIKLQPKRKGEYSFTTQLFVLYCLLQGKSLELKETCKVFGLTYSQFSDKLSFVLKNNLLKQSGDKFVIGPNFENAFKEKRLINSIINNIANGRIYVDKKEFCDIINYTPLDFEQRSKGYIEEL